MAKKKSTSRNTRSKGQEARSKEQDAHNVEQNAEGSPEPSEETLNSDETQTENSGESVTMEATSVSESEESDTVYDKTGKLPYLSEVNWGWHKHDFSRWKELLYTEEPAMALEIGAFDGVSACMMADHFFPHPDSKIYTIDPYPENDPSTPQTGPDTEYMFHENVKRGGHEGKVILLKGESRIEIPKNLPLEEYAETFDFIFVDGAHDAKSVLQDAIHSIGLLKHGGIIIFDDFEWQFRPNELDRPKAGILAFESIFKDRLELVFSRWARCYRKK